jgi:hypothetical protein
MTSVEIEIFRRELVATLAMALAVAVPAGRIACLSSAAVACCARWNEVLCGVVRLVPVQMIDLEIGLPSDYRQAPIAAVGTGADPIEQDADVLQNRSVRPRKLMIGAVLADVARSVQRAVAEHANRHISLDVSLTMQP